MGPLPRYRVARTVAIVSTVLTIVACAQSEPVVHVVFERVEQDDGLSLSDLEARVRSRLTDRGATELTIEVEEPSRLRVDFTDTTDGSLASWLDLEPALLDAGGDARVLAAPIIVDAIERRGMLQGTVDADDLEKLAARMELGSLLSGLRIVEKKVEPAGLR